MSNSEVNWRNRAISLIEQVATLLVSEDLPTVVTEIVGELVAALG